MDGANRPHSYAVIDDTRLEWWDDSLSALISGYPTLSKARSVCEVGIGMGHWMRILIHCLPKIDAVTGIDVEHAWIEAAREPLTVSLAPRSVTLRVADACTTGLSSESFDIVTCQTLLMHVRSSENAVREMLRILRPGGVLILAEPINLINRIPFSSTWTQTSAKNKAAIASYWIHYNEGVKLCGAGDNDVASILGGTLAKLGCESIKIYQNQSTFPSHGKRDEEYRTENFYWSAEQVVEKVKIAGMRSASIAEAHRAFDEFERLRETQIRSGEYVSANAASLLLFLARKPEKSPERG